MHRGEGQVEGKTPGPLLSPSFTCFSVQIYQGHLPLPLLVIPTPTPSPRLVAQSLLPAEGRVHIKHSPKTGGPAFQGFPLFHPGSD